MSELIALFAVLGALIFIGWVADVAFRKTNIPDVLILLLIGIIIGYFLQWVSPETFATTSPYFVTFALIYLAFEGALSLDIRLMKEQVPNAIKLSILNFASTLLVCSLIGHYWVGMSWDVALILGCVLGGISHEISDSIASRATPSEYLPMVLKLESAMGDVLAIFGVVFIAEFFVVSRVAPAGIINKFLSMLLIALAIGLFSGWVWTSLVRLLKPQHAYVMTIGWLLLVYSVTEYSGGIGPFAVIAFAFFLGNSSRIYELLKSSTPGAALSGQAKTFYSEFSFLIKTFFFIYMGILFNFTQPILFLWGFIIVFGLFLVRPAVVRLAKVKQVHPYDSLLLEVIIPRGLSAAVVAQFAMQYLIPGVNAIGNIVLSVIFLSIVMTSLLVFLIAKRKFPGFYPLIGYYIRRMFGIKTQ